MMGMFSWKTQDTGKSICATHSGRKTFAVYMTDNNGNRWEENEYEGYGEFGGKDFYELLAEMNGLTTRQEGIDLAFSDKTHIQPNLTESEGPWKEEAPDSCEFQGYFYDEEKNTDNISKPKGLQGWYVKKTERKNIKKFIETWHYSKSINGCNSSYCYALFDKNNIMKGALFYGRMAMFNQYKKFSDKESKVIELRRLCCVDDTPKNAESFFIGGSLRQLKKDWGGEIVVSYADKEYGHTGTIYKASNWEMIGETKGAKVIIFNGKKYHDKTIRTKYKGQLKPYAQKVKDALESGDAYYKTTKGKYTYQYTF